MPSLKREVASDRRRRSLFLLVAELQKLQATYPDLRQEIQNDIDSHLRQAARTREADRGDVLAALSEWPQVGLTVEDIVSDTGLSERTVRGTLDEMQKADPPLVRVCERAQERGRPARVFFPLA
jgi:predicted transcriptional regulator